MTSTLRVIPDSDDDNPTSDTHELVKTTARHVVVDASASGRPHRGKSLRFTEDSELRLTQHVREHSGFVDVAPAFGEWLDSSPQDCATDLIVVGDTQLEVYEPQGDDESDHDESNTESEFEADTEELISSEGSDEESDFDGSNASEDSGSASSFDDDGSDGESWDELERKAAKCQFLTHLTM